MCGPEAKAPEEPGPAIKSILPGGSFEVDSLRMTRSLPVLSLLRSPQGVGSWAVKVIAQQLIRWRSQSGHAPEVADEGDGGHKSLHRNHHHSLSAWPVGARGLCAPA